MTETRELLTVKRRHGLWQWHWALRHSPIFRDARWWDGEMDKAQRAVKFYTNSHLGGAMVPVECRPWMAVVRCARRYMRRFGVPETVGNWNAICGHIGDRRNAHDLTMRAVLIADARPRTKLRKSRGEFSRAYPVRSLRDVAERHKRLVAHIEDRRKKEKEAAERRRWGEVPLCEVCKGKRTTTLYLGDDGVELLGLREMYGYPQKAYAIGLCRKCDTKFSQLVKTARQADEDRKLVNSTKRKLRNEAAKIHARTA